MTDLTTEVSPYTKEANTSLFKEKRDGKKKTETQREIISLTTVREYL